MNFSILSILILLSHLCNLNKGLAEPSEWKNIVSSGEISALINRPYVVLFFAHSAVPQDALLRRFNNHFSDAKGHLQDFGVEVAVVDCFTTPEFDECTKKKDASDKVHFFRNGRLLTDLPLDAMFNFDAIIANILHLILLQEVPLLQTRAEFEKTMMRAAGKYDVIFARMKAVGISEDRAFVETAFAFSQKYQFIMTTINDNFGIDSNWEPGSNSVWLLQCKTTKPRQQCPVVTFMNAISLEKLIIFVKALEIPNAVELTDSSSLVGFLHLNIPVVCLSGASDDVSGLRSVMNTLATEFVGNVGFILLNRDAVTDKMKSTMDLTMPLGCSTSCAVLKTKDSHETITMVTTDNLRIALKKVLEQERSQHLKELQNEEKEEEEEDETNTEELYTTAQETQDDPVEQALFKLQAQRKLNVSETKQLNDKTFPEFISSDSITMVLFTVKWNPVCAAFLEAYQKIGLRAKELKYSKINPMARVECSNWPDVCQLNNATYYPTLKIFRKSTFIKDYLGRLDEQNVLKSYFLHSISSPLHLDTRDQFISFHQGSYPSHTRDILSSVVFGIFPDPKTEGRIIFEEVAKQLEGSFLLGICTHECANEGLKVFDLKNSAIVTAKWKDPYQPFVVFMDTFNKPSILSFIRKSSQNILPELNPASLPSLLGKQEGVVMLFHQLDNQSKQAESELAKVAARRQFESTPITWIDSAAEGRLGRKILTSYSLPVEIDKPQIIFLNRRINLVCWYPHAPQYSESLLTDWLDGALAGGEGSCAAALRHREWTEMVEAYDFLAYIKEDEEAEEKIGQVNMPSGRIRQVKSQKETKEPHLRDDSDGAGGHGGADGVVESDNEGIDNHKHTEL